MPARVPIRRVDGPTAYGEIHARCALAGTGDLRACHRMMSYDRALVAQSGSLSFDAKGDLTRHSFVWYRWREGRYSREP